MTLTWYPPATATSSKGIGYIIEYKEVSSTEWIKANDNPIPDMTFRVDDRLNWMATYHFRVTAETVSGQGPASEISDRKLFDISYDYETTKRIPDCSFFMHNSSLQVINKPQLKIKA